MAKAGYTRVTVALSDDAVAVLDDLAWRARAKNRGAFVEDMIWTQAERLHGMPRDRIRNAFIAAGRIATDAVARGLLDAATATGDATVAETGAEND